MADEWKEAQAPGALSDEEFLESLWESEMGGWQKLQQAQTADAPPAAGEPPVGESPVGGTATSAPLAGFKPAPLAELPARLPAAVHLPGDNDLPAALPSPYPSLEEMVARLESEIPTNVASPLAAVAQLPLKKEVEQHLVFSLAGTRYAIPTTNVIEVGRMPMITAVPNVPAWVLGVTNRRGDIISVIDFRSFLHLEASGSSLESKRILFVKTRDEEVVTALVVDQINRIANLEAPKILPEDAPPEMKLAPFLRGSCEHNEALLAVLDLERLLHSHEVRQFESQASLN